MVTSVVVKIENDSTFDDTARLGRTNVLDSTLALSDREHAGCDQRHFWPAPATTDSD